MKSQSTRKVSAADRQAITAAVDKALTRPSHKKWPRHISRDAVLAHIFSTEEAYIVSGYLVVYAFVEPWFSNETFLYELLVLRISGHSDFGVVPAFLEAQAREAGCALAMVGTSFARSDRALASLYTPHGFVTEALTLTKEL